MAPATDWSPVQRTPTGCVYCNITPLLLAAWLPARQVTSCLQNVRAPKRDTTGRKSAVQSCVARSECVGWQAKGERMLSVCVCVC